MVAYNFGPAHEGIQSLIGIIEGQDPAFAQSIYDSSVSDFYGVVNMSGSEEPLGPGELVATQHVFWDGSLDKIRSQGVVLGPESEPEQILATTYQRNGVILNLLPAGGTEVKTAEVLRALHAGRVITLAAWDYVRDPRGKSRDSILLRYPRLLFDHVAGPELARTTSLEDMPPESLDESFRRALLASAVAYRSSNQ